MVKRKRKRKINRDKLAQFCEKIDFDNEKNAQNTEKSQRLHILFDDDTGEGKDVQMAPSHVNLTTSSCDFNYKSNKGLVGVTADIEKYWHQRYRYFSKFDQGIEMDKEAWFSVTPEAIAMHVASRMPKNTAVCLNAFCGVGSLSIHLTKFCNIVYCIDIDPDKIAMAKINAQIYNVANKIEFIVGDFFENCAIFEKFAQVVYLDPPWGGPSYNLKEFINPQDINLHPILLKGQTIGDNLCITLPKNINIVTLKNILSPGSQMQLEQNFLNRKLKIITGYIGLGFEETFVNSLDYKDVSGESLETEELC